MHPPDPHREKRANQLTMILGFMGFGGFLAFMVMISGGLLLYMLLAVFIVLGIGVFHYLLWGHEMNRRTDEEREEAEIEEEAQRKWWDH